MRIMSARTRDIIIDRARARVGATVILTIEHAGQVSEQPVPVSAPIVGSGGASLRERLIAVAKLMHAFRRNGAAPDEAVVIPRTDRDAA